MIRYRYKDKRNGNSPKELKMKYTVKYRKQKHDAFANVGEIRKATRGKFAGTSVFRDRIFDTYEEAESVRKVYAEKFGEENTKITERKG